LYHRITAQRFSPKKVLTSSSFSDDYTNNTTGPSSLCVRVGSPFMGTGAPFSNPYDKPYKSVAEQIALLLSRGMTIADIPAATTYLERMGYYRLSGYWYPFPKSHILRHALTGQPILHPVTGKEQVIIEDDFRLGRPLSRLPICMFLIGSFAFFSWMRSKELKSHCE
jgi:hypothetical protein